MADIVLLFILKGRDCMSKVLIEVLVIILIAGSYLILYSAVRVSAISEQRIAEIRSRETFDKEKQLKTNQSSISGGMAMTNKEKKIEGRLGYNSENGRYGLLVSDLWEHTGFHCGECLEVKVDDKWVKTRMEMDIARNWYLVDTPYTGDLENKMIHNSQINPFLSEKYGTKISKFGFKYSTLVSLNPACEDILFDRNGNIFGYKFVDKIVLAFPELELLSWKSELGTDFKYFIEGYKQYSNYDGKDDDIVSIICDAMNLCCR